MSSLPTPTPQYSGILCPEPWASQIEHKRFIHTYLALLKLRDRISLNCPGCPCIHFVAQAGLDFVIFFLQASQTVTITGMCPYA